MRNEKVLNATRNVKSVQDELLTRREVADLFKCSLMTIIRHEQSGHLKPIRIGANSVRFRKSDVLGYIESCVCAN